MTDESEVCTKISEKVKMAGFLEKKGSMLWKRYWFVLEDKLLLYYKSQLEYINLSPCRGSLNMSLVSAVQPRRNSKDPIIHLVSRSQSFILKAKDRAGQEKWLQALLDSVGKQGMSSLRFSLDDLPGQMKTMTLPKRLHGGSLDAVWKPPVIPKTRMLDKILGYEEETDENQNTDKYDLASAERKSQTLDNRKMDSKLEKLRNAIGVRKSSAIFANDPAATKVRRESFLHKMFKRSPTKIEKEISCNDSDTDDPFYDTIDHVKTSIEQKEKPIFGTKILLPEGTMAELKDKLRSKESLEQISLEDREPPQLPPRSFSNSMNALPLPNTTEAVIHLSATTDSEDSELSGHYQTIKKPEVTEEPISLNMPSIEPEYQVINKSKKKKYRNLENELNETKDDKVLNDEISLSEANDKDVLTADLCSNEGIDKEVLNADFGLKEDINKEVHNSKLGSIEVIDKEVLNSELGSNEVIDKEVLTSELGSNEGIDKGVLNADLSLKDDYDKEVVNVEIDLNEAGDKDNLVSDVIFMPELSKENSLLEMEKGLSDLNVLLMRLTEITTAPLAERDELSSWSGTEKAEVIGLVGCLQRSSSEPDYDIPRSHAPIEPDSTIDQQRISATEFFNKTDLCTDSSNSLEPDSLEDKIVLN